MSLKEIKNAKSLGALARALSAAPATLKAEQNKISQYVAKYAIQRLIYETPVDTSQALSNWQVNLHTHTNIKLPAYFYGEYGTTQGISASTALGAAYQQIARKKYGMALVLYNNLTYINKLNAGASSQADANYVNKIAEDAQNVADAALRELIHGN